MTGPEIPVQAGRGEETTGRPNGDTDEFSSRTQEASAHSYFHYYGMLSQQQNMMQDLVRTGAYRNAVMGNKIDFAGKTVMDIGAGSGLLSFFAVQAGAKKVYAVEASNIAQLIKKLVVCNGWTDRVEVIHSKVETMKFDGQVDVLISEPMGVLLVNERMLESYIYARQWLHSTGKMYPSNGTIFVSPFSDHYLFSELTMKAVFWQNTSFFGINLSGAYEDAVREYTMMPVIDTFDPSILLAPPASHLIDFMTDNASDLEEFEVPFAFNMSRSSQIHGLACWFNVDFCGSTQTHILSTAPGQPLTHWHQCRLCFMDPVYASDGQVVSGTLRFVAHERQSYIVYVTVSTGDGQDRTYKYDLKDPYYRQNPMAPIVSGGGSVDLSPSVKQQSSMMDVNDATSA